MFPHFKQSVPHDELYQNIDDSGDYLSKQDEETPKEESS